DALLEGGQTSLLNLTANPAYWRVRHEPDAQGRPRRRMVCFKNEQAHDPELAALGPTTRFRDPPYPAPEDAPLGTMYADWARLVFSSGSIYWPLALSADPRWVDTRVQKLTWNVLEAALSHRHPPRPPPDLPLTTHDDPAPVLKLAKGISAFAGKAGLHAVVDG